MTRDEIEYLDLARSVVSGRGLTYPDEGAPDRFSRAPLYPLFIAGVLGLSGQADRMFEAAPLPVKIAQCLLGALAIWLIARLAERTAGARAGITAAAIAAVYPPLVWISAYVFSETLYMVLALAGVIALAPWTDGDDPATRSSRGVLAAAGGLAALAALTRPAHVLFVAITAVWLATRRGLAPGLIFALAAAAAIAPWTIRNFLRYDRVIMIAAEGGVTFWTGNHPLAIGEGDLAANPELKRADQEFQQRHPGLSAEALEPLYYRDALGWIVQHPAAWLGLVARKLFYLVVPIGPSYRLHSTRYIVASVVPYVLLLPAGVAGAWVLSRRPVKPRALGLLAASAVLTALIFMPQERFRIPVIDPALIVSAAALARQRVSGIR
jgi:4-amino-4-deoxy-L-arabinose transferase-like glycosyltransferase